MKTKAILINVGGLLSEALMYCKNPYVKELLGTSLANICAKTVSCPETHFANTALMYSTSKNYDWTVKKHRHIFSVLAAEGKKCSGVYTGNIFTSTGDFEGVDRYFYETAEAAMENMDNILKESDFAYIYFGDALKVAREKEYMKSEYLEKINELFTFVEKIRNDYPIRKMIICSDHGGHGRVNDTDFDSDVTIPIILSRICGYSNKFDNAEIIDIAPTVSKIFGIEPHSAWEGESLI